MIKSTNITGDSCIIFKITRFSTSSFLYGKQVLCGVRGVRGDMLRGLHTNTLWQYNKTAPQSELGCGALSVFNYSFILLLFCLYNDEFYIECIFERWYNIINLQKYDIILTTY